MGSALLGDAAEFIAHELDEGGLILRPLQQPIGVIGIANEGSVVPLRADQPVCMIVGQRGSRAVG